MTPPVRSGFSREARLLTATIAVSVIVLVVLSRFRFPDPSADSRDGTSAQPLARLAARAAFDDLSLAVRELSGRVSGSLIVLRTTAHGAGVSATRPAASDGTRLLPALRVRDDVAAALVDEGALVEAVIGVPGTVTVIARDPIRGITLVRIPSARAPVLNIREGQQALPAPGYVAVAEASAAGTSVRPIFVGRSDSIGDPRWDTPLLTMGRGAVADIGAPVFTLEGRLAGLLTSSEGEPALVPAEVVMSSVDQLLRDGPPHTGEIGVVTQAVDSVLAAATGAAAGAAVAAVRADGPAAQVFAPGDVITAVNGQLVRTPDALRLRVARTAPGVALMFTFRRDGAFLSAPVTVRAGPAAVPPAPATGARSVQAERTLGLTLKPVEERGSEVTRVQPGSLADAAGLQAGDVVLAFGRTYAPAPEAIASAFAALPPGRVTFLSVERNGQPRLVALQR
ncbi:putative periplasmic serine endoprotease DegP-like precursor [Luteitalea pratensis]|uniref:Putative periplasmic serine endoprotease DegP-like n=1 Tax=Luteitalea pratensis TaxID=1855912 RepID=A0A143PHN6_LUTPR|nr:PDZ domain-containing protein [Luteitalea pratensis]AMY07598.1 putative periplasmic serine endoprotease DegP-like precursor [Luteitalea pratensis]